MREAIERECAYALFNDKVIDAQQSAIYPQTANTDFRINQDCAKCGACLFARIKRGEIIEGSRQIPPQCKDL